MYIETDYFLAPPAPVRCRSSQGFPGPVAVAVEQPSQCNVSKGSRSTRLRVSRVPTQEEPSADALLPSLLLDTMTAATAVAAEPQPRVTGSTHPRNST